MKSSHLIKEWYSLTSRNNSVKSAFSQIANIQSVLYVNWLHENFLNWKEINSLMFELKTSHFSWKCFSELRAGLGLYSHQRNGYWNHAYLNGIPPYHDYTKPQKFDESEFENWDKSQISWNCITPFFLKKKIGGYVFGPTKASQSYSYASTPYFGYKLQISHVSIA